MEYQQVRRFKMLWKKEIGRRLDGTKVEASTLAEYKHWKQAEADAKMAQCDILPTDGSLDPGKKPRRANLRSMSGSKGAQSR